MSGEIDPKKKILRGIVLGIVPIETAFLIVAWKIQNPLTFSMHAVILLAVFASLWLFRSKVSDSRFRMFYMVFVSTGLTALLITHIQDFSGLDLIQYSPWMIVVAVMGIYLVGHFLGILWAGVYLIGVGVPFLLSRPEFLDFPQLAPLKYNLIVVCIAIVTLTAIFEWLASRTQRELIQKRRQAEQADTAKSEFLANMSHELRTPLTHIIGFTELVIADTIKPVSEQQAEYLSDVLKSSNHLLSLINDVLDISKIEAGKMAFDPAPLDIRILLQNCVRVIEKDAALRDIKITMGLEEIPGEIHADDGIGVNKNNVDRIFEVFEQGNSSTRRRYAGTGLGLSLSKKFVEMHGGSIRVESQGEGKGSKFIFNLPVRAF